MNQAARTFALVGTVVLILLAFHWLPAITVGGTALRHVNILADLLPEANRQQSDADIIPTPTPARPPALAPDTVADQQPVVEAYRPEGVTMIEDYSGGQHGGMSHFYQMLHQRNTLDRPVRIAYFSDSFIEGDVFTAHLREQLQQQFGGNGVGWVDPIDKPQGFRLTIKQKFKHFKEYEVMSSPFVYAHEGINQRYFVPLEGASVWTRGTDYCPHAQHWQQSTLYLRTKGGVQVGTCLNDQQDGWRSCQVDSSLHIQQLRSAADTIASVSYRFTAVTSDTYIYGMALESRRGVILDNFAMRGSSGSTLAKIPAGVLSDFSRLRPYDLIVLHFGSNVVSDQSRAANYKAYTRLIGNVIAHLRQAYPETSILLVSVSDRSQRTPEGMRTISGIESLAAYQQILADSQRVAYFNLFQAMGGRESMVRLVEQGLANKDYTHLTHNGGKQLSTCLYESLVAGYENYRRRHQQ